MCLNPIQIIQIQAIQKLDNHLYFCMSGIGVDDMFIIVQALETLEDEQKKDPVHIKMGHVLKRVGVSITVTSLTDVAAFAIGATTVSQISVQNRRNISKAFLQTSV